MGSRAAGKPYKRMGGFRPPPLWKVSRPPGAAQNTKMSDLMENRSFWGSLKGPRGPFKGPRGPLKGPRGPFKGTRGPFKGPRGPRDVAQGNARGKTRPCHDIWGSVHLGLGVLLKEPGVL